MSVGLWFGGASILKLKMEQLLRDQDLGKGRKLLRCDAAQDLSVYCEYNIMEYYTKNKRDFILSLCISIVNFSLPQ